MSVAPLPQRVSDRALLAISGAAEAGALVLIGVVMVGVVCASQVVRIAQESAERRSTKRGRLIIS